MTDNFFNVCVTGDGIGNVQPQEAEEASLVNSTESGREINRDNRVEVESNGIDNEHIADSDGSGPADSGQFGQFGRPETVQVLPANDESDFLQCRQVSSMLRSSPKVVIESLFHDGMWYKGGICFLFGDTGIGKTTLATQIGRDLGYLMPDDYVGYIDFENDDNEFVLRYQKEDGGVIEFPPNFLRFNPNWANASRYLKLSESGKSAYFETYLKQEVKKAVEKTKDLVDYFIVDNVSMLIPDGENTQKATEFMIWLKQLKASYGNQKSFMVLAHTPKVNKYALLDANQMAGSKSFHKYTNTLIGMKRVPDYPEYMYLGELKNRVKEESQEVVVYKRVKDDVLGLHFEELGPCKENLVPNFICSLSDNAHLMPASSQTVYDRKKAVDDKIASMLNDDMTEDEIVAALNLNSRSRVRTVKMHMRKQGMQLLTKIG